MAVMHSLYHEGGTVSIDEKTCTRCGQCVEICAGEVLTMEGGRVAVRPDSPFGCIACGHCMMICPTVSVHVSGRGLLPDDIQPMPPPGERATPEALAALMRARRSMRHFTTEEVSSADLDYIVEMATTAPMGIPPWDIGCVVIRGRENVQALVGEVVKGYEGFLKLFRPWVLTLLRPFVKRETYDMFRHFVTPLAKSYVDHWREHRDTLFYEAPAVLLFHHSPYAEAVDAAIACTYAMLAAEARGLGNTMIGGAPPILQRNKPLCRSLGIPDANKVSLALIVGHPAVQFRRTIRRRFTSVKCSASTHSKAIRQISSTSSGNSA